MNSKFLTILGAVAVGALALGAGYTLRQVTGPGVPEVVATDLGAPFELLDHSGAPITEASFEGRASLLFFGFTHCPEICPTTVYDIDTWLTDLQLGPEEIHAYFVTLDPERDTPEFLADYLTAQSEHVTGITGAPEAVWDMARSWRVYWAKRPLGEGDYTIDHYTGLFVLNDQGQMIDLISHGEDPEVAKAKIRTAIALNGA